jgi:ATP-dependent RNA helicase SUPV3L1/SUV3
MYQNGDVDYLVATDAIGMGLNLDVNHVAFSALSKFDGRRMRRLAPNELAQIAGRAGRYMTDGSFGVTGEAPALEDEVVEAITNHSFTPIRKLQWRNADLSFGTVDALINSLEAKTDDPWLVQAREADDLQALKDLADDPVIRARASDGRSVRLLWDVCRVPDFRGISQTEHATLLHTVFTDLHEHGAVREDWFARQVKRIDRVDGDIDALSKRLAYIRTWTYVAQRNGWLRDVDHWRGETRAVEDRLSDALHEALTKRFVDRRTSVLLRRLKQKESLVAEVNDKGEVSVEGEFVGRLEGFRFRQDTSASPEEAKTLRQASLTALAPEFHLRADRFYNAPDTELDFTEQGGLMWGENAVGKLVKGDDVLKPRVQAFVDEEAGDEVAEKVARRLQHFIDRKVAALFEPMVAMQRDETLTGLPRGFAFRLIEALGVIPRGQVAGEVKELDQDARGLLRKHGVRFGQFTIFMPLLLKPAPTRLRLVLWSLFQGLDEFPEAPPPGLVTIPVIEGVSGEVYTLSGYHKAGQRAIRIDMLERLADQLRAQDSRGGFEANPDMLSITGLTLEQFADLMQGLGYKAERAERPKAKPVSEAEATPDSEAARTPEVAPVTEQGEGTSEAEATPEADTPAEPEVEVYYTFTWAGFRAQRQPARRPAGAWQGRQAAGRQTPRQGSAQGWRWRPEGQVVLVAPAEEGKGHRPGQPLRPGAHGAQGQEVSDPRATMRADKWLWHARFFKTRGLATKLIAAGHLRVNGTKVAKSAHGVGPGDVLTFPQGRRVRVIRLTSLSERRGPAPEAQALYEDLTPEETHVPKNPGFEGKGRPSGKDRRNARLYDPTRLE